MKRCLICLFSLISSVTSMAQEPWLLHRYDETNSSLEGRITQVLQDRTGMLWIATWSGLNRFDGYEFMLVKPKPGDGCSMASDRIRDIWLSTDGNDLYVKSDDDYYRLDLLTYTFHDLDSDAEREKVEELRHHQPGRSKIVEGGRSFIDAQGLEWRTNDNVLSCYSRKEEPAKPISMSQPAHVRCLKRDSKGRIWVGAKDPLSLHLMADDGRTIGYIDDAGNVSATYRPFSDGVYCMTETRDGRYWLGCKPGGLLRLTEQGNGRFLIERIEGLLNTNVYDITEDQQGRLWVATLGGGMSCIEHPGDAKPTITNALEGFPDGTLCEKVRCVHITPRGVLLAATTGGLVVAKVEDDIRNMRFHRHIKEPARSTSLSCNAIIDIVQTGDDRIFLATETGGVNELVSSDLLTDTLQFAHFNMHNDRLPTDITLAMADMGNGHLLITGITKIIDLDINRNTYRSLGHLFFMKPYKFSEARPLVASDGRCLLGTTDGAFWLDREMAHRQAYQPPLLLTGITIQSLTPDDQPDRTGTRNLAVSNMDTLRLSPTERSLTIHFSALDFTDPQAISYQFRMGTDSTAQWNKIGHDHDITLFDLKPGTYRLAIRSTNADGQWTNNTRELTIIVEPTFWETPWAVLLFVLIGAILVAAAVFTLLYIRRIKRKQQETLAAYLELLEFKDTPSDASPAVQTPAVQSSAVSTTAPEATQHVAADDPFVQRLLQYVEDNIGNSDTDISRMAEACAVSRSVLQRKMKQTLGVTPADFMREARLKRACQLLKKPDSIVSDVAYRCGFSDPKYFSRCFKQSFGLSPSDFKQQQQ